MAISKQIVFCILAVGVAFVSCKDNDPTPAAPYTPAPSEPAYLAFEGASGGGSFTTGGRGGMVYVVTSLDDANVDGGKLPEEGTFRDAVNGDNRIIVFAISGVIHLKCPLTISHQNISIFGQTAPGGGICLADYPVKIEKASNILLQFMRFRMGDAKLSAEQADGADALSVNDCQNVLIDHCSMSWSTDECCSCYGNENFTLQYCFITESLRASKHKDKQGNYITHGYGGIWGGKNASFHHNLLAHHDSRNPRFDHDYVNHTAVTPVDFINNVVYNWKSNSAYGGEGSSKTGNQRQYNFINNYFKPGPSTTSKSVKARLLNPWTNSCDNCKNPEKYPYEWGGTIVPGKFYVVGNIMDCGADSVTNDNWKGVYPQGGYTESEKARCKSLERFSFPLAVTDEQTAADAYTTVLDKAGCSLSRDAYDTRIVSEVKGTAVHGGYTYTGSKSGTKGIIDTPTDVSGGDGTDPWGIYNSTTITDTDEDGIPDAWEDANGLDKNVDDSYLRTLSSPYMNIEVYAHDLVKHLY